MRLNGVFGRKPWAAILWPRQKQTQNSKPTQNGTGISCKPSCLGGMGLVIATSTVGGGGIIKMCSWRTKLQTSQTFACTLPGGGSKLPKEDNTILSKAQKTREISIFSGQLDISGKAASLRKNNETSQIWQPGMCGGFMLPPTMPSKHDLSRAGHSYYLSVDGHISSASLASTTSGGGMRMWRVKLPRPETGCCLIPMIVCLIRNMLLLDGLSAIISFIQMSL